MAQIYEEDKCVICCSNEPDLIKTTTAGRETLVECSRLREDLDLHHYLLSLPETVLVHNSCRKSYTDKRKLSACRLNEGSSNVAKKLRSSTPMFNFKENCFFCSEAAQPGTPSVRSAMSMELRSTVLQHCKQRSDEWGLEVQGRLEGCCDLPAEEAVYHRMCYLKFVSYKHKVGINVESSNDPLSAFESTCEWLEDSCEKDMYTLYDLVEKMESFSTTSDGYSPKHMKRKLIERYGDHLFFAEVCGKKNVICFRDFCSYVINEKWYSERKLTADDDSQRIVKAAAKLIANEIRDLKFDMSAYPSIDDIAGDSAEFVPPLLQQLLGSLISSKVKTASIGQSIVQAARSYSIITPVQLGLGVSVDHDIGSKTLIQQLARLGFSVSYDEVIRYKQSVINADNIAIPAYPVAFTQWVADNADHNVITLDGSGTFHGMGIISASTYFDGTDGQFIDSRHLKRIQHRMTAKDLVKRSGVPIVQYCNTPKYGLTLISLKPLRELRRPLALPLIINLDLVWHMTEIYNSRQNLACVRPNWSGYMQYVVKGDHKGPAVIRMMPLIDLSPSDETCVHSTLLFVIKQASKLQIPTPSITFDQPLWLKAVDVASAGKLDIVCMMGGFHTMMNLLGSIGRLMSGSGLEEILKLNFGENTVTHMMSGKSFSRAVRGHLLIDASLTMHLINLVIDEIEEDSEGVAVESDEANVTPQDIRSIYRICQTVWDNKLSVDDCSILEGSSLTKLTETLLLLKTQLVNSSRTAKLWIQYMQYISSLKNFIVAERTGNWSLHLSATHDIMNLFAATGHTNYAKSTRLYLQMMNDLESSHPWLHAQFSEHGLHSVRRSSRFWAGLSPDLVIEQVMMRSIKGRAGLTRGRGIHESVRVLWIQSIHECATVANAVRSVTGHGVEDEKHKDLMMSRAKRDHRDFNKTFDWLNKHPPFSGDRRLRSLSSGLMANDDDGINCDDVENVGQTIQQKMDDIRFSDVSVKRSDQIKTLLNLQHLATINNKSVEIDASILFHRLVILVERSIDRPIHSYFDHELTAVPASLFKDGFMRKANKPALAHAIMADVASLELPAVTRFVLDGGALLYHIKWIKGGTFKEISQQYVSYVGKKYGNSAVIVFDGYGSGPETKDHEHSRRYTKSNKASPDVDVHEDHPILVQQQLFLSNDHNKDSFIKLLIAQFRSEQFRAFQSSGDADTEIVSTTLELCALGEYEAIGVVADDTDILVLLVHHLQPSISNIYFIPHSSKVAKEERKPVSIRDIQQSLGPDHRHLLMIHAFSGCDTTSSIFGHGKGTVFRKVVKYKFIQCVTDVMQGMTSTQQQVAEEGLRLLVFLYSGDPDENLNAVRYKAYCKMVSVSLHRPQPEKMPPTERAAFYHLLRVHLQVVRWSTLSADALDPTLWGWRINDGKCTPIMTDLPAAADDILTVLRCKCKTGCKETSNCSCRGNSLVCVSACSNCHGTDCSNVEQRQINDLSGSDTDSASECGDEEVIEEVLEDEVYYADSDIDWEIEEEIE